MKVKDYEYSYPSENYQISQERQKEMIKQLKNQIRKDSIAHFKILSIGKNDDEYDFMYDWLDKNHILIRGIDGTISGEILNFEHTPKMGQSYMPDSNLSEGEEMKLFRQLDDFVYGRNKDIKTYTQARDKLIISHMRLAKWVANWKGINKLGIPLEEKEQMAYIGLINAVDKFNVAFGNKFSTYACKAIYRRIITEWYCQNPINAHTMEQLDTMQMTEEEIESQLGRKATKQELAQIMGITENKVTELLLIRERNDTVSLDEIETEAEDFEIIADKLDDGDKIQEDEEVYFSEGVYLDEEFTVPCKEKEGVDPIYEVTIMSLQQEIDKILGTLTEREADILRLRFGMYDGRTHTQEEVGQIFGITGGRIGVIEQKAIRKLRHPAPAKKVRDFYIDGENLGFEI